MAVARSQKIRGPLDAPKFKDYTLPLVFLKRLSDVFDDEVARLEGGRNRGCSFLRGERAAHRNSES